MEHPRQTSVQNYIVITYRMGNDNNVVDWVSQKELEFSEPRDK